MGSGRRRRRVLVPVLAVVIGLVVLLSLPPAARPRVMLGDPPRAELGLRAQSSLMTNLSVQESGLPNGSLWEVGLRALNASFVRVVTSTGTSFQLSEPEGAYALMATTNLSGFAAVTAPPYLALDAANSSLKLQFVAVDPVEFIAENLPSAASWRIGITSGNLSYNISASLGNVTVGIPPGRFSYGVESVGFTAIPSTGNGSSSMGAQIDIYFEANVPKVYDGIIAGIVNLGDNASVFIGGVPALVDPGGSFLEVLQPGRYGVEASAPGYAPYSVSTYLVSNATQDFAITLLPWTSNATGPSNSTRYFDGVAVGAVVGAAGTAGVGIALLAWSRHLARGRRPPLRSLDLPPPPDGASGGPNGAR